MNFDTKKEFNVYAKKFKSGDYDLGIISEFINAIMSNIMDLESNEFEKLIEIPISIAKYDIYYKDEDEWLEKIEPQEREYFRKKAFILKDSNDFFKSYYERDRYELNDFIDVATYIKDNFDTLVNKNGGNIYAQLLNPLIITIRDYCEVNNEDSFKLNNNLFAKNIEEAINLN